MNDCTKGTILIVGAGFGQIPAIKRAYELGLKVIAVDKNPNAPGFKYCHVGLPIDVIDFEGIVLAAKIYRIDGIMTIQTDLPIPTIGKVNDTLNLAGISYKTAENCSNKIKTRKHFILKNVLQPKFEVVSSIQEAKIATDKMGFPCVFKSADSSGSRGVTKLHCDSDIVPAFKEAFKHTQQNAILVEEFIDGTEIGAQAFSVNGKCEKVFLHNDILSSPPYMIPIGHSFPIKLNDHEKIKIETNVKKAVEAMGIENGPSNIDLILDKNNRGFIIEIGARIGATCLPELVLYHTGIDWIEQSIRNALGLKTTLERKQDIPVAAMILESTKDGILTSFFIPDEVKKHPQLKEVEITAKAGEQLRILRKGTDRIGKLIVTGETAKQAEDTAIRLRNSIIFKVQ